MKRPRPTLSLPAEAHARFLAAAQARGIPLTTLVEEAIAEPLGQPLPNRFLIEAPTVAHRAECLSRKTGIPVSKLVDDAISAAIDAEARRG